MSSLLAHKPAVSWFRFALLVLVLSVTWLLGCGDGNSTPATTPLQLTLNWPARSRDVNAPASALSVTVKLTGANPTGGDFIWAINREARTEAFTQTYTSSASVAAGTWPLSLTFYAQPDAAGAVVGTSTATVTIAADGSGIGTVAVTGTVASVEVTPDQTLLVGQNQELSASVRDAASNLLAVTPGSFTFAIASGADKLSLTPGGTATGMAAGVATVTATVDGKTSPPQNVTVGHPLGLARSPWPKFQADARNTGNAANTSRASHRAPTGVIAWASANIGVNYAIPIIGTDGTLYIGGRRHSYALDGSNGTQKWAYEQPSEVRVTAALAADGTVYTGAITGPLQGLDSATGAVRVGANNPNFGVSTHISIGSEGTVYYTDTMGKVHAFSPTTGADIWSVQFNDISPSAAALAPNGTLYVGTISGIDQTGVLVGDHKLHALDATTGIQKWEFEPGHSIYAAPTIGDDGTVYFGAWDKKVYALDSATGAKKWEFTTGGLISGSVAIGSHGVVYVGSYDHKIYALDAATGAQRWVFETGGRILASPALDQEGNLYIGSEDHKLYALDAATGTQKWALDTGGAVTGGIAIGADGTLYLGSGGRVIAVQ